MDAPVVPIRFEITAPTIKRPTLAIGVAFLSTLIIMPPDAIYNEAKSAMNCTYSAKAWTGACVSFNAKR